MMYLQFVLLIIELSQVTSRLMCTFLCLFPVGCVSHRQRGEGQADASKAVQGESQENER